MIFLFNFYYYSFDRRSVRKSNRFRQRPKDSAAETLEGTILNFKRHVFKEIFIFGNSELELWFLRSEWYHQTWTPHILFHFIYNQIYNWWKNKDEKSLENYYRILFTWTSRISNSILTKLLRLRKLFLLSHT